MPRSNAVELDTAITEIGSLRWEDSPGAQRRSSSIFAAINVSRLLDELKSGLDDIADIDKSVEKTTHYKWLLGEDPSKRFQVWLHEYKPKTHRREGHASVAHNHRFWLSIQPIDSRRMRPGDTMVLAPEEIHALSELRDGTLSLIVQGRPVRSFSEVFENGEVRRYSDLGAKLTDLQASL